MVTALFKHEGKKEGVFATVFSVGLLAFPGLPRVHKPVCVGVLVM